MWQSAEQPTTEPCKLATRRPRRRLASFSGQDQRRIIEKRAKQWQADASGYQLRLQQAYPTAPDHQSKVLALACQLTDHFTRGGDPTNVIPHQKHC